MGRTPVVAGGGFVPTPEPRSEALQAAGGVELIGDDGQPLIRRLALATTNANTLVTLLVIALGASIRIPILGREKARTSDAPPLPVPAALTR